MYELFHCRCGLIYAERPEAYSAVNRHPRNFCPECGRAVSIDDGWSEVVPESIYLNTTKHWFQPNFLKKDD